MQGSLLTIAAIAGFVACQTTSSCPGPSPSGNIVPSVASGYQLQVLASGLSKPRGILIDRSNNLLVVEAGAGKISSYNIDDASNGCVSVSRSRDVTENLGLNHGIELSEDGKTLYASTPSDVYSWTYDGNSQEVSRQETVVTNMTTSDHTTRTLLLPQHAPGLLVVTRGSTSNLDLQAADITTGHSQIKAFNLDNATGTYDFNSAGLRLAWGIRNEVGITEHPVTGGIFGVENSADQIVRLGVDVHQNNPAEEMNFFGYLNGTRYPEQGEFYGYPWCLTAWNVSELPDNGNLTTGKQFAISETSDLDNQNRTDAFCAAQVAPRLAFQAHMAPLDIKFNNSGTEAWVTFHGSWDRSEPVGYKLSVVSFGSDGQPVAPSDSMSAAVDIITNADNGACPNDCFRPVGLAIDSRGRIFMSSDASGELYLVTKTDEEAANSTLGSTSTSSSMPSATAGSSTNAATTILTPSSWWMLVYWSLVAVLGI